MAPTVANRWVTSATLAPMRAATLAASQPAWPPPITMTSNDSIVIAVALYTPQAKPGSSNLVHERFPEDPPVILFHVKRTRNEYKFIITYQYKNPEK